MGCSISLVVTVVASIGLLCFGINNVCEVVMVISVKVSGVVGI